MVSISQRPKGHGGAVSALDVVIQTLTLAGGACGVPPAQIALGSTLVLLTMIRVRFPLPRGGGLLIQVNLGLHDQRTRLHRTWTILRGCVSSPRPGVERETIGRAQPARGWGHRKTDFVSLLDDGHPE